MVRVASARETAVRILIPRTKTEGVGKSTIITSLIKEFYVPNVRRSHFRTYHSRRRRLIGAVRSARVQVQHVVPEVMIPPEVTPENVTTFIIDTGCASASLVRPDGLYAKRHCILGARVDQVEAMIGITWSQRHGKRT
jgi:Ras family protein T1